MNNCLTKSGRRLFAILLAVLMIVGNFESTLLIKANQVLSESENVNKVLSENEVRKNVSDNNILPDEKNIFDEDIISAETLGNRSIVSQNNAGTEKKIRVLFIGNSFTNNANEVYKGSVKDQLNEIAIQNNKELEIKTVSVHASRLQYFYEETPGYESYYWRALAALRQGNWDYVVLQEKTSVVLGAYESEMKPVVKSFKKMISELQPNAKILLYMTPGYNTEIDDTWTGKAISEQSMERRLGANYDRLGYELGIDVVYAGMQIARAKTKFPKVQFNLYEDKHPSANGYLVIALCFYDKIFGEKAKVDVTKMDSISMSQSTADEISRMVHAHIFAPKRQISLSGRQTYKMNIGGYQFTDSSKVKYTSLDPNVATVSSTGKIKGISSGNTTIVAETQTGLQAFCNVNVSITISFVRESYVIGVKEKIQILPSGLPLQTVWKSSRKKVATVDQNGMVTARKPGKTVIKVYNKRRRSDCAKYVLYVCCEKTKNINITLNKEQSQGTKKIQYRLHWNKVLGAKEYKIYRSDKRKGKYKCIGRTSKNVFVDKKVFSGCNRFYKIVAINKDNQCNSIESDPIKASTLVSPSFKAKSVKKKYTEITWSKVKNASEYAIYRSQKKNGVYQFRKIVSQKQGNIYRELTNGKHYYYKVIACSKNGTKSK